MSERAWFDGFSLDGLTVVGGLAMAFVPTRRALGEEPTTALRMD